MATIKILQKRLHKYVLSSLRRPPSHYDATFNLQISSRSYEILRCVQAAHMPWWSLADSYYYFVERKQRVAWILLRVRSARIYASDIFVYFFMCLFV
jgi:hypothetical protein